MQKEIELLKEKQVNVSPSSSGGFAPSTLKQKQPAAVNFEFFRENMLAELTLKLKQIKQKLITKIDEKGSQTLNMVQNVQSRMDDERGRSEIAIMKIENKIWDNRRLQSF